MLFVIRAKGNPSRCSQNSHIFLLDSGFPFPHLVIIILFLKQLSLSPTLPPTLTDCVVVGSGNRDAICAENSFPEAQTATWGGKGPQGAC